MASMFPLDLKPARLKIMLRSLSGKSAKHFLSHSSLMRLFSSLASILEVFNGIVNYTEPGY